MHLKITHFMLDLKCVYMLLSKNYQLCFGVNGYIRFNVFMPFSICNCVISAMEIFSFSQSCIASLRELIFPHQRVAC